MRPTEFSNVSRGRGLTGTPGIMLAALVLAGSAPVYAASRADEGFAIRSGTAVLQSGAPRQAGKVPVVFVHGMLGTPGLWSAMIERLSSDAAIAEHFQLLTFGYDSLQPIPESARELREALAQMRRRDDPEGRDASFDRIVVVGHSLGGLIAKAAANGDVDVPSVTSDGAEAVSRVGRLIFIATPHRGTPLDRGVLRFAGVRVARSLSPSLAARPRCHACGERPATSVDQLTPDHPLLLELERARATAAIPFHSIIAALGDPTDAGSTDGLVPVASARLEGARSEIVVRGSHLCHRDLEVIREVRRILGEHTAALHRVGRLRTVQDPAPGNGAAIGGIKVITAGVWFAARPFGAADVDKLGAECFRNEAHLCAIVAEAQRIVNDALSADQIGSLTNPR